MMRSVASKPAPSPMAVVRLGPPSRPAIASPTNLDLTSLLVS